MKANEVIIIESRSASDHFNNIHEGRILQQILELEGVNSKYIEVIDQKHLEKAFRYCRSGDVKYVHFSCHGSEDGFSLTDDTHITWELLDKIAWPILKDKCLVFSSCNVGKGIKELFVYHKTFCNAIVAPIREIKWSEGVVAYSAFYHRATSSITTTESDVKMMNTITKSKAFSLFESPTNNTTYTIGDA